jgi:hypothetical protein
MVKRQSRAKRRGKQGASSARESDVGGAGRIPAETLYRECSKRLTAFGGPPVLMKLLDLLMFEEAFSQDSVHPKREPKPGAYRMVVGVLLLLFSGSSGCNDRGAGRFFAPKVRPPARGEVERSAVRPLSGVSRDGRATLEVPFAGVNREGVRSRSSATR